MRRTIFAAVAAVALLSLGSGALAQETPLTGVINAAQSGGAGRTGEGLGRYVLDSGANTLTYDIQFSGLSGTETVSHIHGPAVPGVSAGVLYSLPLGSPKAGTINLVDLGAYTVADQKADLLDGLWYTNIHSTNFGGGEIRGQIVQFQDVPSTSPWGVALLVMLLMLSTAWLFYRFRGRQTT